MDINSFHPPNNAKEWALLLSALQMRKVIQWEVSKLTSHFSNPNDLRNRMVMPVNETLFCLKGLFGPFLSEGFIQRQRDKEEFFLGGIFY